MKHEVKTGSVASELSEHALDNTIARVDVPQNENTPFDLDRATEQLRNDDTCEKHNNIEDKKSHVMTNLIGNATVKGHNKVDYDKKFASPVTKDVVEFVNKTRPEDTPCGQDQSHRLPDQSCRLSEPL